MIEYRDVGKRFPDGTVAVEHFDLVVPSAKITVLLGSSGCGKTTLLRMVNRMVEPTSGSVLLDGVDVADEDPVALRRRIGYVMQNAGLMPHFNILDNIATVPRMQGEPKRAARASATALLRTVGLDPEIAQRYPSQLSGGQQQRVGVARALAADPQILLMDEPFGAVDPVVRGELQRELLRLQRELAKTVVFVTHDVDEALLLADFIVVLGARGRIRQVGTPDEILEHPADEFVASFIGADRGKRELRIKQTPAGPVVIDGSGRTQGRLIGSSSETTSGTT